jgi:aspartate-semialdehyde dehydrogenase
MPILPSQPEGLEAQLAFSALPADTARGVEPRFAQAGVLVCSNASAYRREADVPILLPEVNPQHACLVEVQRRKRGWKGGIVTNPNCTSTGLTVALKALQNAFGLRKVMAVSLQAVSGAGYPGVASLDILDNAIPYIGGEEEKLEWEPRKMLGSLEGDTIQLADFVISAHTNRVAVSDGHLVCASIELGMPATVQEAAQVLATYQTPEISRDLPSAPQPAIMVRSEPDRPQPRLDRMLGKGMTTVVGRVRPDPLFTLKLVVLSHNTIRGAAGGAIYNAELMLSLGLV